MNIYDPADGIRYVHLSGPADARPSTRHDDTACAALPAGYANQSPVTRLQRRPPRVRGTQAHAASLPA